MSRTKDRIRESNLRYKQSLGQNFLYDEALLASLAAEAGVTKDEDVLEIGPGCGSLTKHLCENANRVLAVELDERLIPLLRAFLDQYKNLTVVQGDVMALNLPEVTKDLKRPFAVVANIPYYITTPLIKLLLTGGLPVSRLALMVQREVADKILAEPGDEAWGPLSILCRFLCEPRLALDVPAEMFTPPPKVDSAFVVLPLRDRPSVEVKDREMFFRVAGAAFALRRKTMVNNLCASFRMDREEALRVMAEAGLDEKIRGEKLTLEELAAIADAITNNSEFRIHNYEFRRTVMSIAKFTHVSEAQYSEAMAEREDFLPLEEIPLPKRATAGSAGYDFVSPLEVTVPAGGSALIPTGVRAEMEPGWVLMLFPRSSLGFRHSLRLSNTVGVIDSDYAFAKNEGHIMVKLRNPLSEPVTIGRGERFCQGVFLLYGTAEEEQVTAEREGGFGSTDK